MKTAVRVLNGRHRGKTGWIAGDLESRHARGITKALVYLHDESELLETKILAVDRQLSLFAPETQKDPPPARGPTAG